MRKSKSAPSLPNLIAPPTHIPSRVVPCSPPKPNALPSSPPLDLVSSTSQIEHAAPLFISKVPFTQVYQCYTHPSIEDVAFCIATPHDPVEESQENGLIRPQNTLCRFDVSNTLARYQLWWERIKRRQSDE